MWQFVQPHYIPSKTTDKKKKKKRTELRVCVSKNRGWNKKNPYVSKLTRVPPPPTPTVLFTTEIPRMAQSQTFGYVNDFRLDVATFQFNIKWDAK
jgi:hypothetical protein